MTAVVVNGLLRPENIQQLAMDAFRLPIVLSIRWVQPHRQRARLAVGQLLIATLVLAMCNAAGPPSQCSQVTDVSGMNDVARRNPTDASICLTGPLRCALVRSVLEFHVPTANMESLALLPYTSPVYRCTGASYITNNRFPEYF